MSSHRRRTSYFSRKYNARKALLRGLMVSLVEHERITTTVEKAKELRRHIEKAITLGKKDDLSTRRLLISRISNEKTVDAILKNLSKRFKNRPGGYTRIIKIGRRPGDTAEMAFIEFVDYKWDEKAEDNKGVETKAEAANSDKKAVKTAKTAKKASKTLVAAKKKSTNKKQKKARAASRA